ncbi:MAG TPA: galactose-1-phosphate uridylyltransferase [Solirubrobacteraceae bacterium]|nr:galactose-1-phosphate uridylyltransferase [Solirubrobacteraceae bacterium]
MARELSNRPSELYGPLEVARHVKDDGRALILYSRARADAGADADADGDADGVADGAAAAESEPGAGSGPTEPSLSGQTGRHSLRKGAEAGYRSDRGLGERPRTGQRFDELRGEQVVYAIDRQERTFLPPADHCPLCPTQPGGAPTEIPFAHFEIAVFDNRFPALRAPHGAAEVVVYTDGHEGSLGTLSPPRARALMWVWRHRYLELGAHAEVEYVMAFENRGVEVGVTLHHPHGQIYAYPFLPPVPGNELQADARLGGCAQCRLLARELNDGVRVVFENEAIVVYVPFAARWAYEAHVVMRTHRPSLLDCEPRELDGLASGLQALVRGYDALFDRPFPYVMAVHQAPSDGRARGHVHVEFYPPLRTATKLKYLAGSEQGAGTFISDTLPEESAPVLRAAIERADGDGVDGRR